MSPFFSNPLALFVTIFIYIGVLSLPVQASWLVHYGENLTPSAVKKVDVAFVEPESVVPTLYKNGRTKIIAYLSIGEAESYRDYWKDLKKQKNIIVRENPNWKKNYLIDIRKPYWQNVLLNQMIPPLIKKGFDGLVLDTIDTAIELEEENPKKYKGSKKSMVAFIKKIKSAYPKLLIYPNNGLEILPEIAPYIDGIMVEDVHTRYNFKKKKNEKTPINETLNKEKVLDAFKAKYKKPIYSIIYAHSPQTEVGLYGIQKSEQKGYQWYLSTVDLSQVGVIQTK